MERIMVGNGEAIAMFVRLAPSSTRHVEIKVDVSLFSVHSLTLFIALFDGYIHYIGNSDEEGH